MRELCYEFIRHIFNILTYGILRMEVIGEENIPAKGPFIMASNHASNFDPPLVGTAMRHHLIHFMAKEELFHNPILGGFLRYVRTFPVRRGHIDRKAVVEAIRVVKSGGVLGIFPEGKRCMHGKLLPFHEGMAAIAAKTGVAILPTAIIGSRDLPKKHGPVRVVFGKVIIPEPGKNEKEDIAALNNKVRQAVSDLMDKYGMGLYEGEKN